MARFTNFATLSYSGGSTNSNTVTGELVEALTAAKTAVSSGYGRGGSVTYVLTLVNSGGTLTGLTVTDNLGGYTFAGDTLYPLSYRAGTLRYYVGGVLQPTPTVTAGPPMTVTGLSIPAGSNAALVYEAALNDYAPLGAEAGITNTATVTGDALANPVTAQAEVFMEPGVDLRISKALCPATVTENGRLTYTFVIENAGSRDAAAGDNVAVQDVFDPILRAVAVSFNGTAWTEGTQYTYDAATGTFATVAGQITVPAATYTQQANGTWTVTPGTSTLEIQGTV